MKIKSIRKIESNSKLYDIETKKNHNFFANNILVHNSNFSTIFYPEGYIQFARRSDILSDDNFYDYKSAFQDENWSSFAGNVIDYCFKNQVILQFVGELFGLGVQKRIYYGPGRYWKWYAIYSSKKGSEDIKNLDYIEMYSLMEKIDLIKDYFIEPLKIVDGLDEALQYDIKINSLFTPEGYDKENLMEGVVIRPEHNYRVGESLFILKHKNEKFKDNHAPKPKKIFNVSEDFNSLYEKVSQFINENRTADLFSKYGPIDSMKDFGKYLGYYSKDVYEEMIKFYPLDYENLEKEEQKILKKKITSLIKDELMESFR
jgi:Rnl2 family RNA ligase